MRPDNTLDDQETLPMGRRLAKALGSVTLAGSLVFGAAACGDDDVDPDPGDIEGDPGDIGDDPGDIEGEPGDITDDPDTGLDPEIGDE